jgi:hypothetical protein
MTQDQYGRSPGYVVSGEVVPDDETEETSGEETTPMTRFQKVASALRGDRPTEPTEPTEPTAEQDTTTDPGATDPNGTWPARSDEAATVGSSGADDTVDDALAVPAGTGEAGTGEAGAVRSPDAGSRDYWDDEQGRPETAPRGARTAADPSMTGRSTYATTEPAGTAGAAPEAGYGSPADTAAGYGAQAGTATDPQRPAGAVPAGAVPPGAVPAGTAVGAVPAGAAVGTTEGSPAGRHAAGAAEAGLRPGEATDSIGDFGDIAFGNLLPDAEQYTTQWQQIQFRFVDDPQGSVTEAADVITQVTTKLEAAIQERQRAIEERQRAIQERASALRGRWGEGANADTETLRETLRMYRAFMDQLIGSTR